MQFMAYASFCMIALRTFVSKSIIFFLQGLQSDGRTGEVIFTKSSLFSVIWQVAEVRVVLEADWL